MLDVAIGETIPGRALRTDDLMLWYSSGKPLTTVAVLQLWERERLGLDDLVADYIDGWGNGKERCTLRHVLTHTGGFPMFRDKAFDEDISYRETIRRIAAYPADWVPGTAASYHPVTGWKVLGAVVEAVDGRPIDRYLREEIIDPLGMSNSSLGIPLEAQARAGRSHRPGRVDGSSAAKRRPRRSPEHGSVSHRPPPQSAVAHREGRARRRDARPGPRARALLRVAPRTWARTVCSSREPSR